MGHYVRAQGVHAPGSQHELPVLPRSPPIPPAGQGGKGLREALVSYLEFRGAPFISNQQQVTLTIHYNLLLKAATLEESKAGGRVSGERAGGNPQGRPGGLRALQQRQARCGDRGHL